MTRRVQGAAAELLAAAATHGWLIEETTTMRRGLLLRTTKHQLVHGTHELLILEHRSSGDLFGRQTYVRRGGEEVYWLDNTLSVRSAIETRTVPPDAQPVLRSPT